MPHLVRDRLFFGNIGVAADVLQGGGGGGGSGSGGGGDGEFTHVLSLLSSASISFFTEWRPTLSIPTEEIRKVYVGGADESPKKSLAPEKLLYALERAGPGLKLVRMAVPLRDTEDENLLDYLEVCLDFIDEGRKEGSVLVHCFAGVSRSAAIVTAYLMRTEQKSLEDALESLKESCEFVCPNDGFLDQTPTRMATTNTVAMTSASGTDPLLREGTLFGKTGQACRSWAPTPQPSSTQRRGLMAMRSPRRCRQPV